MVNVGTKERWPFTLRCMLLVLCFGVCDRVAEAWALFGHMWSYNTGE